MKALLPQARSSDEVMASAMRGRQAVESGMARSIGAKLKPSYGQRFKQAYQKYNISHYNSFLENSANLSNWYQDNMTQTMNLLQATQNYPVAAVSATTDTTAYTTGSLLNTINYMGWNIIDIASAAISATFY